MGSDQDFKDSWNQLISQQQACFLQSYQWGEFQKKLGYSVWYLSVNQARALIIKRPLPLGQGYLYCPRGPVLGQSDKSSLVQLFGQVREIAKNEKSIFFKVEPENDFPSFCFSESQSVFGLQSSSKQIQPSKTIILDLRKPAETLLSQMHSKTRYNIRLAGRRGVEVEFSNSESLTERFIRLQQQTAQKNGFRLHPEAYYKKLIEVFFPQKMAELAIARYQGNIVAMNLILYFGNTAYYLYGASDYDYRQIMAPYLLQWETIQRARKAGYQYYDFWGVDEQKWPGVSRFKRGFNGRELAYPGAYDLIFSQSWYLLYNLAKKFI